MEQRQSDHPLASEMGTKAPKHGVRIISIVIIALAMGGMLLASCDKPDQGQKQEKQQQEQGQGEGQGLGESSKEPELETPGDSTAYDITGINEVVTAISTKRPLATAAAEAVKNSFKELRNYTPRKETPENAGKMILYLDPTQLSVNNRSRATRQGGDPNTDEMYLAFRPNQLLSYKYEIRVNKTPYLIGNFYLVRDEDDRKTILQVIDHLWTLFDVKGVLADASGNPNPEATGAYTALIDIAEKAKDGLFAAELEGTGQKMLLVVVNAMSNYQEDIDPNWFESELLKLQLIYKSLPVGVALINDECEKPAPNRGRTRGREDMLDAASFDGGPRYQRHRLGIP